MQSFGQRVRAERKAAGLTMAELARAADCSESTIWDVESGRRMPSLGLASRIATALGASLDYLVEGES